MDPGMSADNRERMVEGRRHSVRRRERGAALIEFALVFPMLMVLTLTVVDVSRAFFVKNLAYQAAREGARVLVVSSLSDSAAVRLRVMQVAGAAKVTLKSLSITGPDANQLMGVTVGVQFNWLFRGMFAWLGAAFTDPATLTGVAWMRKEGA
jgi:Flp pilus assembly protein TadG